MLTDVAEGELVSIGNCLGIRSEGDICQWLTVEFGHLQTRISGQLLWDLVGQRLVFAGNCRGTRCGTTDSEKLFGDSVGRPGSSDGGKLS